MPGKGSIVVLTLLTAAAWAGFGGLAGTSARADIYSDCNQSENIERSISGCTTIIERGSRESVSVRAKAHFDRGNAYGRQGKNDRSIADYTKAIELDPKNAKAHLNRGTAYASKGQFDHAMADYNESIALNSSSSGAYLSRGTAFFLKAKFDYAIADFDEAIELDPNNALAYNGRGYAYYKKGQRDHAISDARRALAIVPGFRPAQRLLMHLNATAE